MAAGIQRRLAASPMAQKIRGTAKARGTASYSNVSTVGPATTAPSEQMAATASDGPVEKPERFGEQEQAPDAEGAGDELLGFQNLAEAEPGGAAQGQRDFVIQGEGDVRVLGDGVVAQDGGIAEVLQDGDVDLRILLQPGVAGELEKGEQRQPGQHGKQPQPG